MNVMQNPYMKEKLIEPRNTFKRTVPRNKVVLIPETQGIQ